MILAIITWVLLQLNDCQVSLFFVDNPSNGNFCHPSSGTFHISLILPLYFDLATVRSTKSDETTHSTICNLS